MIAFFQRHKTIRNIIYGVVVITFVGAGFVGYGSLSLNNKNIVKNVYGYDITRKEYNFEINNIAASHFKGYYGNDKTSKIKEYLEIHKAELKEQALKNLIYKYKKIYIADKILLSVDDKEIVKLITNDKQFYKNDKFNKNLYLKTLSFAGYSPKEYETLLKNQLLLNKLNIALYKGLKATDNEINIFENIGRFSKIVVANIKNIDFNKISLTNDEHLEFWKKFKDKYIKEPSILVKSYIVSNDSNLTKDEFRKKSLKTMLQLKNNNIEFNNIETILSSNSNFNELKKHTVNEVLKPIYINDNKSIIYKIEKINLNDIKTFEEAFEESLKDAKRYKIFQVEKEYLKTHNIENNAFNYVGEYNIFGKIPVELDKKISNKDYQKIIFDSINNDLDIKHSIVFDNFIFNYQVIDTSLISYDDIDKKSLNIYLNNINQLLYKYKGDLFLSKKFNIDLN